MRFAFGKSEQRRVATTVAIVLGSALLGSWIAWTAPGLERYSRDWLMRTRGELAPPEDIAIVAIDEKSIQRFGRFPWPRSVMAQAIERLTQAQVRAIALDVLYADPTTPEEDEVLAEAIRKAGNVIAAAQLTADAGRSVWLLALPEIGKAAASVGHVNVHAESESVAREVPLRSADDEGTVLYALPVEAIRVAERIPAGSIVDRSGSVIVGSHEIPVNVGIPSAVIGLDSPQVIRAARIPIDYIGPPGAFAPSTYSIAEVIDGSVPDSRLRNKYVLIGATAASIGERFAVPFTHDTDVRGDQHGALMSGVEVLANTLNTILRKRFYADTPGWLAFVWAALVAAATIRLLSAAEGGRESVKQTSVLFLVAASIALVSFVTYKYWLIYPPVTEQFVAFASAGVLGLLRRSVSTGAELDRAIQHMANANGQLLPRTGDTAAEAIGRLLGGRGAAVVRASGRGKYQIAAAWGLPPVIQIHRPVPFPKLSQYFPDTTIHEYPVTADDRLLVAIPDGVVPSEDHVRTALSIARTSLHEHDEPERETLLLNASGIEARARALGRLNANMIDRWRFVDQAMRSAEDGLVIAGPDGRIRFANPAAAAMLRSSGGALIGRNLLDRLAELEPSIDSRELMSSLLVERTSVEREIAARGQRTNRYVMKLAPVVSHESAVIGLVASFSDITRQQELQQTKNDVISLVSHEMRTPLTAIQGMSELLANYEMAPERRRELNLAINDEAKRLTRMISLYLDITRLESGATVLRRAAVRIETLIERTLLLLEPLAAQRDMSFARDFDPDLPVLLADADLLARALENLLSNAVKYGSAGTVVRVGVQRREDNLLIEVEDRGAGIASADIERIFDKFYRVPRPENADVPGTGLGLPLVREIAELHGGTVSVRSEPGRGSVFTLSLPLGTTTSV